MRITATLKILAGAIALAASGGAYANTTLTSGPTATSDLFLVVNDLTDNTSFVFDTGILASTFTGNSSISPASFNLTSNPIWTEFLAVNGASDIYSYSVLGGIQPAAGTDVAFYTATSAATATLTGAKFAGGFTQFGTLLGQVNLATSSGTTPKTSDSSATAAFSNIATMGWTTSGNEGTFNSDLQLTDSAAPGTALAFFSSTNPAGCSLTNGLTKCVTPGTAFKGVWNFASGVLSYTVAAVPLPAPVLLLLSGLGLMGVIARRRQSSGGASFGGAIA